MINLLKCHGRKFSATIVSAKVTGRIAVVNNYVYLCQNKKAGSILGINLRFGYKYSWCIKQGSETDLKNTSITNLKLLPFTKKEIEIYKDWQVGDEIENTLSDYETAIVIFRSDELVVVKYDDSCASENFTCDQLYANGWRLQQEESSSCESVIELSMDEIAEKFGIDVDQLKIKKQ